MRIELHIERLVLEGLPVAPGQRHLVQAALETELSRLMTEGGLASSLLTGGAIPQLSAGSMQLSGGANPTDLGQQIAHTVYTSIGSPS